MLSPPAVQRNIRAMACSLRRQPFSPFSISFSRPSLFGPSSGNHPSSAGFILNLNHRPYLSPSSNLYARFPRSRAASSPPPPPEPESQLPSNKRLARLTGLDAKLGRLKDSLQIFFAVLFWMSLFFWSCVWDDKNSGNPTKGSRFKR